MAVTTPEILAAYTPTKPFFVGIDSDGCAFDSMEIKWKECFIPRAIEHCHLQSVSRFARECMEFVNLYSQARGVNRFFGLLGTLDWMQQHPGVQARGFQVPAMQQLRALCARDAQPTPAKVKALFQETQDPELAMAVAWSDAVNADIHRMVHGLSPFPLLRESLARLQNVADILIISSTPHEALEREWHDAGILPYVNLIGGQEAGSKKHMLATAAKAYDRDRVLMIGDAPGDMAAAQANGVCYYPILPGAEEKSWHRFFHEALDRFTNRSFRGPFEDGLIAEFAKILPEKPHFV